MDVLVSAAEAFVEHEGRCSIDVSVCHVTIEDIDYAPLKRGSDFVRFPVVLRVSTLSTEDSMAYHRDIYIRGTLSGSFSEEFSDMEITCQSASADCRGRFRKCYTDDLLPVLHKDNIEKDAETLLNSVYRYTECRPQKIQPVQLAQQLGIKVLYAPLSHDCSIRGEYFYEDTNKVIYNEKTGLHETVRFPARTILVEKALKGKWDIVRFTIMHELVHAVLQKYAFMLAKMCNPDFTSFFCPIRLNEGEQFVDPFIERMERYADSVASCALMPKQMFCTVADQRFRECGALRDAATLKSALDHVTTFFGVSTSACRRRFLELGYAEMRGICNFLDGQYVPPYCFKPGSLEKNQTYAVSAEMAQEIMRENKKLVKLLVKGRVRFIENHFVVNHPNYLTRDMKLTDYARNHLDECALKIDLVYPAGVYSQSRFNLVSDGMYRTAVTMKPLTAIYAKNNEQFEMTVERAMKEVQERDADVKPIVETLPEAFPLALRSVVAWTELTHEEFAFQAGITPKTLGRLLSGETKRPTPQVVMRICIGLCLPVELSLRLMNRSGNELRTSGEDLAYMKLLFFSGYYTIEQCNVILKHQGFTQLGVREA